MVKIKNGWGYGKNYSLLGSNKLIKTFENEDIKVYKASIIYFGYLTITYINNLKTKVKTIVLKYDNKKAINYDVTNLKSKKDIVDYILNNLLYDYLKESYVTVEE